jgi:hypothetical protein
MKLIFIIKYIIIIKMASVLTEEQVKKLHLICDLMKTK